MTGRTNIKNNGSAPSLTGVLYCYSGNQGYAYVISQNPVAGVNNAVFATRRLDDNTLGKGTQVTNIESVVPGGIYIGSGSGNLFSRDSSGDITL